LYSICDTSTWWLSDSLTIACCGGYKKPQTANEHGYKNGLQLLTQTTGDLAGRSFCNAGKCVHLTGQDLNYWSGPNGHFCSAFGNALEQCKAGREAGWDDGIKKVEKTEGPVICNNPAGTYNGMGSTYLRANPCK